MARQPDGPPPPPVVQRLRLRYAKRGRLRFTSHRDFARAFERALRRADIPMGYSAGFNPHPKISYLGAAPTGVASEAEYLEISLTEWRAPAAVRAALDRCLPAGLDIEECVEASGGSLAERIEVSRWRLELPGVDRSSIDHAVAAFEAAERVMVERLTKSGRRSIDARSAVISICVVGTASPRDLESAPGAATDPCAILELVVRQVSPAVRPDDVTAALAAVAGCAPSQPSRALRLAQGRLDESGQLTDPLAPDRAVALAARGGAFDGVPR